MKKICIKCSEEKNVSDFRKDNHRVDGHRSECKQCSRTYNQSAYMQRYKDKVAIRTSARYEKHSLLFQQHKATCQCVLCGEREPVCLEFHHPDPSQKDFGIAESMGRKWETIMREIQKCVVVCSNCHKKLHAGLVNLG